MSEDLERRLTSAFHELPGPAREVSARARTAVLATIPPTTRRRTGRVLAIAVAMLVLLAIAAAALAATGRLHVALGVSEPKPKVVVPTRLALPQGAHGFAIVAGGKLSLVTRGGVRIEGLEATTVELSPHALYLAAGIGSSLVAMAPSGRRVWVHRVSGRVIAAAWAPDALEIAYVVAGPRHDELRLIEGDGDHDRLVDVAVGPVKPTWRRDSAALAYIGAGGRPVVYDLGHDSRRVVGLGICRGLGPVRTVAFAPHGSRLAFASQQAVWVARVGARTRCQAAVGKYVTTGVGWLANGDLVSARRPLRGVGGYPAVVRHELTPDGSFGRAVAAFAPAAPAALALSPESSQVVVVLSRPGGFDVVTANPPPVSGFASLGPRHLLLRVARRSPVTALSWR